MAFLFMTPPPGLQKMKERATAVIPTTDGDMPQGGWEGGDCQINACRMTQGVHLEHL